jgi:hypothetical protein
MFSRLQIIDSSSWRMSFQTASKEVICELVSVIDQNDQAQLNSRRSGNGDAADCRPQNPAC